MYFHNYLSDSSGQKISTYSQLEEGVVHDHPISGIGRLLKDSLYVSTHLKSTQFLV